MRDLIRKRKWFDEPTPRSRYDVVIVGGGVHGLATAYYLASRHGIRNIGVFERSYIGAGGSGRNTTVLRANQRMAASLPFYVKSLDMYRQLSAELGLNLMFSQRGQLNLAHTESSVRVSRERALASDHFGGRSEYVEPHEVARLCPELDMSGGGRYPILGAIWHPAAAIIRHDAVVWGYARAAAELGVRIHQGIAVDGLRMEGGRCVGVTTHSGRIDAGCVISAVAGHSSEVAGWAGLRLPIRTHALQAFVTEPVKPIIHPLVASVDLLVYISQTDRGEVLVGAELEQYPTYSFASTWEFASDAAARTLDLVPALGGLHLLRQWTGICDVSRDYSPIMGASGVDGLYLSCGWGTWGFKAAPAASAALADIVSGGGCPEYARPFALDRFWRDRCVSERGSAGTH